MTRRTSRLFRQHCQRDPQSWYLVHYEYQNQLSSLFYILSITSFSFYGCSIKGIGFKSSDCTNQDTYEKEPPPRLKIADSLIYRKSLYNLNRDQVVELLGIPRDHGYFKSYDLVYWLGPERGFF